MPRIQTKLCEHVIGMLMLDWRRMRLIWFLAIVAVPLGNSRTEYLPQSGRPHVTTPGQDLFIMNRFQTSAATAANSPATLNNITSAQIV